MHKGKRVFDQEQYNPCLKEQHLTQKCFDDNNYDKDKCQMHMYNYKSCKEFWNSVKWERKRKNIKPHLPPPEEREQIKKDFFASLNK